MQAAGAAVATIEGRLLAAGYRPLLVRLAAGNAVREAGIVSLAEARIPRAPGEQRAFSVEVDFACTCSFQLTVSVFDSHADAAHHSAGAGRRAAQAIARLCPGVSACRRSPRPYEARHSGVSRDRVIGVAEYQAFSDNGTSIVPLTDFKEIVAVASGT